jgi:hypothetical protein
VARYGQWSPPHLASVVSLASGGLLSDVAGRVSDGGAVHRRSWMGRFGSSPAGGGGAWRVAAVGI